MKQGQQPVTKQEFDEGMQMVTNAFENVVTKEDLKNALEPYATKKDLKQYATKEDLQEVKKELLSEMEKFATKEDMVEMKDEMKSLFVSAVERIEDSVLVTQREHGRRITALERR
ncbi:MAG: hypothetical protein AAB649_06625 [Patescibacteria group bacterium]